MPAGSTQSPLTGDRRNGLGRVLGSPQQELLSRLRLEEEPMRAEFLSLEQLSRHGQSLAIWHHVAAKQRRDQLLARLNENERVLDETRLMLGRSAAEGHAIPPAGEWLLDNYYLIQNQIRLARQHLPRRYSMELPQLAGGPSDGLPRVYDIALELISHADGLIDARNIDRFVAAYQSAQHLRIGELWAIPIMLRLALIENLRRVALRVAWQYNDRRLGEHWAARVTEAADESFGKLVHSVAELVDHEPPITSAFVSRFTQSLQGRLPTGNVVTAWLENHLSRQGQTVEQLINADSQSMAADQVSMGNSIASLRALEALDWKEFVEQQSVVERTLRHDPTGVYPLMSFPSRDSYRHVVEKIAKRSALTEEQIARLAVEHAEAAAAEAVIPAERGGYGSDPRRSHVGYYLVDRGRPRLEQSAGYRPSIGDRLTRLAESFPLTSYLGGAGLLVAVMLGIFVLACWMFGATQAIGILPIAILTVVLSLVATQAALTLVNWMVMLLVVPRPIMRLDFSEGIDREYRTLVVVPTMLTGAASVRSLVDQLEVRYLANPDPNLLFALLTDFPDADRQQREGDEPLLELAGAEIERLNAEYAPDSTSIFHLLHRPRKWNAREGVWMGEERKRGKIADLNRLIRTGSTDAFAFTAGDVKQMTTARFVITLDTDTQLPRGAAAELVGCLAHPLNRPRIDPATGIVVEGYAILQPRVGTTIPEANQTVYSRLYAGEAGIDPYTRQTSDVYQDLFKQGSFIGKGIYDVHAFETALAGRFPDNRVLSHDLIEGCYVRSGLVNDVELFEGFPSTLLADMSRRHRWIRGDWQIAAWLGRQVPTSRGREPNTLSPLARWKIFDNLRRSLVPVALFVFLVVGWLTMPGWSALWTITALTLLFGPAVLSSLPGLIRKPDETPWRLHLQSWGRSFLSQLAREAIDFAILPYTVHCNIDAIVRTVYRLTVSRRRLLEWMTASEAEVRSKGSVRDYYEVLAANSLAGVGLTAGLTALHPPALFAALPVLLAWLFGPLIAYRISQPRFTGAVRLMREEVQQLRRLSRQTWHYFDTFVTAEDHWLPPDNVRLHPDQAIASRTSPTNIGLGLLANVSACDLGYLSAGELLERTARTFGTMRRLPRFRGHFYNWYDTRSLSVILPRYVSAVDSGNLWGHLVVLRSALLEQADRPVVPPRLREGLQDALAVLQAETARCARSAAAGDFRWRDLAGRLERIASECRGDLGTSARHSLGLLLRVEPLAEDLAANAPSDPPELVHWAEALVRQCRSFRREIQSLAFWIPPIPESVHAIAEADAECREALERFDALCDRLDSDCRWSSLPAAAGDYIAAVEALQAVLPEHGGDASRVDGATEIHTALASLVGTAKRAASRAVELMRESRSLAEECESFSAMDFRFLYDESRNLLTIGYNETERRRDTSYYDLLASEARLTSFMAVSRGQVPPDHWFALGRVMTAEGGEPTLLSWSGSMFEYLMPMLVMPTYDGTLLEQACRSAVQRQIRYGRRRDVPWGISESCYNVTDGQMNYQYRAFGVPGLGLQRGLGENLVVAPYASAMAVMLVPQAACDNLEELERLGFLSEFGFYDAIDYTAGRRMADSRPSPCRTVMAHHSGMTLLAFTSSLLDGPMQRRFLADPLCKAHDLLLQERVPHAIRPIDPNVIEAGILPSDAAGEGGSGLRVVESPRTPAPEIHLLSNGRYHLALSNVGGGRSGWKELAVTRWRADYTCDAYGQFVYLRDPETGEFWSNTFQPTRRESDRHQAVFSQGRVEYRCQHGEVDVKTQVAVSPEDDVEVRRLTLTNLGRLSRRLDLASYAEIVLAPAEADLAHRAFSGMFIETEWLDDKQTLLCRRRPRSDEDPSLFLFHLMRVHSDAPTTGPDDLTGYETSRDEFIGRMRTSANPIAMERPPTAGKTGTVLDPIMSLSRRLTIAAEEGIVVDLVTGVAEDREKLLALVEKYHDTRLADRVFELSRSHSQAMLEHLGLTEVDAQRFAQLAVALLYPGPYQRVAGSTIVRHLARQDALWPFGVGGELPIVLGRIGHGGSPQFGEQLIKAHAYWRGKGVRADLVLCLEDENGYRNDLHDRLLGFLISTPSGQWLDQSGGVHVRRSDQFSADDWQRLEAAAAVVVSDAGGTLDEQISRGVPVSAAGSMLKPTRAASPPRSSSARRSMPDLVQFNGTGGFTRDGREYISIVSPESPAPAPWCNVLANPLFGTVVSEAGLGYTWRENAHEFRLTPWSNDPVSDPASEAIYVRDDETGEFFSPTPQPTPGGRSYLCRHGFGYSVWETAALELETELWAYVSVESPAKFLLLTIRNTSGRKRRIGAAAFVEWVLGEHREGTARHVITEVEPQTGALLAQNRFHLDFHDRVSFLQCSERNRSYTCDRTEFLGRCGSVDSPAGLRRTALSGRAGAGADPAAAILSSFELAEGESRDVVFVIGADRSTRVRDFTQRLGTVTAARHELHRVWEQWNGLLNTVNAETAHEDLNLLANGWLFYQTLACRFWGRAAFYQSGGAYGFRDQLQDSLALLHARPDLTRDHLLLCASRQFEEGDVQHWWHPPTGRGVRTRISDDLLWLPYATARYLDHTGDTGILDEQVAFLQDRELDSTEESSFGLPAVTEETASLYEHCLRALRRGLRTGPHGLPLIGSGDWNDGFNRVGEAGRGESVWLAFFLIDLLKRFEPIARRRDDVEFADRCIEQAELLTRRVAEHAWDGEWFRRAFTDDGTPLGSAGSQSCQIDSLPQSWAVLSGAAEPERLRMAMASAFDRLVRPDDRIIRLFTPAFDDDSRIDPGYIKSYPPGVRENGGQYTHAAIWMTLALAQIGDAERAWACFERLCPTRHASSAGDAARYRVEPYAVAADVYGEPPHTGRGGWTWYTGSAGWMYQLVVEALLGVTVHEGRFLRFRPCPHPDWTEYVVRYQHGRTRYRILFRIVGTPSHHVEQVTLDGTLLEERQVELIDDGQDHEVEVLLGIR